MPVSSLSWDRLPVTGLPGAVRPDTGSPADVTRFPLTVTLLEPLTRMPSLTVSATVNPRTVTQLLEATVKPLVPPRTVAPGSASYTIGLPEAPDRAGVTVSG